MTGNSNGPMGAPALAHDYVCPASHAPLRRVDGPADGHVHFVSDAGANYPVQDGIPNFIYPATSTADPNMAIPGCDLPTYIDNMTTWIMSVFGEDEQKLRSQTIARLGLTPTSRVLEIGCGTGRNTDILIKQLSGGTLFSGDISMDLVQFAARNAAERRRHSGCDAHWFAADAAWLPFPDGYFDAVLSTGGVNQFADIPRALSEMARVTRLGGKVVLADEALAPWLRDTEVGKMLINSNPLYVSEPPLAALPVTARDVTLSWILGNAFYQLDFVVADSAPPVDIDLPNKGWRGGSLRSRYHGQLEAVRPETRDLAEQAIHKLGMSMHDWLDHLVHQEADRILADDTARSANTTTPAHDIKDENNV